ncbi:MAG: UDP-N-acetylmuramate dehydrogenase [Thermoleophilaceae bacterium]|nr:UDP-N-acetylmuramate dehydrogenase [Thermoleophilaceae bacterium]
MRDLAELTTLRLGGPARELVDAATEEEVVAAMHDADARGEPLLVLGGGSNLVVADEGFPGTVVRIGMRGVERDGTRLRVAAGEPWDPLVERVVSEGMAGFECLSGIPGLTGATPIQNVGAYGQEIKQTLTCVRAFDREAGEVVELSPAQCGFAYRSSAFKRTPGRWVVLEVGFELYEGPLSRPIAYPELARAVGAESAPLAQVRAAVLRLRRGKGMVLDPSDPDTNSAGSFFTNPILTQAGWEQLVERAGEEVPPRFPEADGRVKVSAAWLVEHAGYGRGYGAPAPIRVSSKHTLAITNQGGGSAGGLVRLAREIAGGVQERFGVELVPEPVFAGHEWPTS